MHCNNANRSKGGPIPLADAVAPFLEYLPDGIDLDACLVDDVDPVLNETDPARRRRNRLLACGAPPRYAGVSLAAARAVCLADDAKRAAWIAASMLGLRGEITGPSGAVHGLLLQGPYGTGKTMVATAAFAALVERLDGPPPVWRRFRDFCRDVQGSYSDNRVREALGRFENASVLLIDDIGSLDRPPTADQAGILFDVVQYRADHFRSTILTTNLETGQLAEQLGEHTLNRLVAMAAFVRMDGANLRLAPQQATP